jgi:hypothetical protein
MTKTPLILIAALASFVFVPSLAFAGDAAPKISYTAKKQGRVHFQDKTEDQAAAAQDASTTLDDVNPADIEPAAGGYEPEDRKEESSLADSLKLPRKN